uniref:uncharacterized protein n=1 Tax=Pristiophorus japonicus TaxID=55135 RepID=UPI00398E683F
MKRRGHGNKMEKNSQCLKAMWHGGGGGGGPPEVIEVTDVEERALALVGATTQGDAGPMLQHGDDSESTDRHPIHLWHAKALCNSNTVHLDPIRSPPQQLHPPHSPPLTSPIAPASTSATHRETDQEEEQGEGLVFVPVSEITYSLEYGVSFANHKRLIKQSALGETLWTPQSQQLTSRLSRAEHNHLYIEVNRYRKSHYYTENLIIDKKSPDP